MILQESLTSVVFISKQYVIDYFFLSSGSQGDWRKYTYFPDISGEILNILSVISKLFQRHDPVGRKCSLYRDILRRKSQIKKSIKKEMTYRRKPPVHPLISEFWRLQRNNYYFCAWISTATMSREIYSLCTSLRTFGRMHLLILIRTFLCWLVVQWWN